MFFRLCLGAFQPGPMTTIGSLPLWNASSHSSETFSESEIYRGHLLRHKRGFPLYVPGPQANHPAPYQEHGVAIGDVGTVTPEGIFEFFFNIFLPAEHPINANYTPDDFSPMMPYDLADVLHDSYNPGHCVSSPTVRQLGLDAPYG